MFAPALCLILAASLSFSAVSVYADETDAARALEEARAKRKAAPPTASTPALTPAPRSIPTQAAEKAPGISNESQPAATAAVPQAAIDAYVRGYFKARDRYADEARKQIEDAKKAQKEANTSFNFRSGKERKEAQAAAAESLKNGEQELKDILTHKKPLPVEDLQEGRGLLFVTTQLVCTHKVNNSEAIMAHVVASGPTVLNGADGPSVSDPTESRWDLYVKGIDATKFVDGNPIPREMQSALDKVLLVDGSKSYQTAFGQRTLPLAVPVEIKSLHQAAMKYLRENKPELLNSKDDGKKRVR